MMLQRAAHCLKLARSALLSRRCGVDAVVTKAQGSGSVEKSGHVVFSAAAVAVAAAGVASSVAAGTCVFAEGRLPRSKTSAITSKATDNYKGLFDGGLGFGQKSAVIVIDFTKAYTTPGSKWYCGGKGFGVVDAVAETVDLLDLAREKKVPIFYTQVIYEHETDGGVFTQKIPLLRTWTKDNPLVEIDPSITPHKGDAVIVKQYPSAFFGTNLACNLRSIGVDTCIIVGCSTSGCIRASVLEGMQHGFRCIVPQECVGDRTEEVHHSNLFDMNAKNGDVVPKQVVIDYLQSLS
eukprot:TRINITY_DN76541_c0_g1_i1.p1 TRINITY_DN76541_c0_g1~~TRINITY_DN76541_c0_g1_i1.p1  ORF type:complete len:293 (+),score=65.66 TRINITY_DN76541_c0_g1_i1:80-958(+)